MATMDTVGYTTPIELIRTLTVSSEPYPYISKDLVCLVGDAAHPVCKSLHHRAKMKTKLTKSSR